MVWESLDLVGDLEGPCCKPCECKGLFSIQDLLAMDTLDNGNCFGAPLPCIKTPFVGPKFLEKPYLLEVLELRTYL